MAYAQSAPDGRLSLTDLAERVSLSLSPCHRRLRALEQSGAISGYRAQLDAEALGLTFDALVFVTMRDADRDTVEAFEQAVATIPNVLTAQRLFGDPDYLLQVVARDLRAFQKLYDERISTLPGVRQPGLHPGHEERRRKPTAATVNEVQRGSALAVLARLLHSPAAADSG